MTDNKFGDREPFGGKDSDTGISGEISWSKLYFMEMERLRTAKSQEEYTHRVRQIEMMLKPYLDKKYNEEIKKAEAGYQEAAKQISKNGTITVGERKILDMELLYQKTGIFESLVFRRKLSPQKTIKDKKISTNGSVGSD